MRIGIVCQYFLPEVAPIGVMVSELSHGLASNGHSVTVFTGYPNYAKGIVFDGYHKRLFGEIEYRDDGVSIRRSWLFTSPSMSIFFKLLNYFSFSVSTLISCILRRQDIYIIISPPLTNIIVALALKLLGRKYILNIQDIYPDVAIASGVISNKFVADIAFKLEKFAYKCSSAITVISSGFKLNLSKKGVQISKIILIPNWIDLEEIHDVSKENSFSKSFGLEGSFVVLYSGTIGRVSGAEVLVEIANSLAWNNDIVIAVVGEGVVKDKLFRDATERKLKNLIFFPFQPRDKLSDTLSTASVGLVTLKSGHGETSVPSKVLGYMAVSRAVVAFVEEESETWRFVERVGCGVCVPFGDNRRLVETLIFLYKNPNISDRLGKVGRRYLEENISCERSVRTYEEIMCELT